MVSRETKQVRVSPSSGVTGRDIINRAVKNIDPDATIYHDDYRAYGILDGSFRHESVNHSAGEYARGDIHANTIEGEFSVLRPWLQAFRGMSKEYACLCCAHYQLLRSRRGDGEGRQGAVDALFSVDRRCAPGQRARVP
jgi:hypothetical protein